MPVPVKTNGGRTPPHLNADTPYTQIAVNQVFELPGPKPDIEAIVETAADVVVISREVIHSGPGFKIVVKGKVMQRIYYISAADCQSVHAAETSERFCGFIAVEPWMPAAGLFVGVEAYIETVSLTVTGPRTIQACYIVLVVPRCEERKIGLKKKSGTERAGSDSTDLAAELPAPRRRVIVKSRTFNIGG